MYVYIRNFARIKTPYTIGMLIFIVLFLIQNSVAFYYYLTMMPLYAMGSGSFAFIFTSLQTLAFIILNWITWI